jgi:hypothetical protein
MLTIRWKVPASVLADSQTSYSINVYLSTSGENGQYQIVNSLPAGQGNTLSSYVDSGGDPTFASNFYFVTYTPAGGAEGTRVLAVGDPVVTEQRIAEQIQGKLPEIVLARIDSNLIDIRKAMRNALDAINAYTPTTGYVYTNLPGRLETGVVVMAITLLYMEHQLQVSIRDYSYGGTGINLQVDRNSKFAATLAELTKSINGLMAFLKHPDWPDPLGIGTDAIATPQARIFGMLLGTGSINP